MDSFELNKLIGAFLGVVFVIFSVSLISGAIFGSEAPEKPGYAIEAQEEAGGGEAKEEEPQDIAPLMADADASKGEAIFKRCAACHTDDQSGENKVGPNLWGVVNRPPASHEGFSYSAGMKKFGEDVKHWDYEHLNHFLTNPRGYVSGTAMSFAGLSKIEDRANVIAYLREQADEPEPLPEPKAEPAADEGQAAEGDEGANAEDGEGEKATPAESGDDKADSSDEGGSDNAAQEDDNASDEQAAPSDEGGSDGATQDEGASGQAPANDNEQAAPADDEQKPASGE